MSDIHSPKEADHLVGADGWIVLTETGKDIIQAYRDAERAHDRLQQSWAGAYLVALFKRHPWLQSLRITLTATAEYNDEGGSYRSVSNSVANVLPVPGAELPGSVLFDGVFDSIEATSVIEAELDDNDLDLYTSFRTEYDDFGELELVLNRDAASTLLQGSTVSGAQAFDAWFPPPVAEPANG